MAKNDLFFYIVGNWKGFNGFMISAIITIIGVTFMGGSLIQLRNSKPFDGDSNPKPKLDEELATGISLYIKFFNFMRALLYYNINSIINGIMYYLNIIPVPLLIFLLPFGVTLLLPILYPIIVAITVIGLLMSRPPESKKEDRTSTHPFRHLIFPPFGLFSYFCDSCTHPPENYYTLSGLLYCITYFPLLFYYGLVMLMYCFANVISVGVNACFGWVYFMWYLFIRPFYFDVSTNKKDYFHYLKIKKELVNYKHFLLIIITLICFTGASLHLGAPLRNAAAMVTLFVPFWVLYKYIKEDNKKSIEITKKA
jgi:hypothetical protein